MYAFDGGTVVTRGVKFVAPDGRETTRDMADPNHAYLIQHPRGLLVWDSGLADAIAGLPRHTRRSGHFRFIVRHPLAEQFAALGVAPADVAYQAYSHLQVDHAGNAGLFSNATLLLQRAEYEHAFGPDAQDWGYVPADYAALRDQPAHLLEGDCDVFGDGSVVILSAPGHTPGHQVLFVDLPHSGPALLSGDLYYAAQDPAQGWIPAWNFDAAQTRQTIRRLADFAAACGARWIINHDPAQPGSGWMD